MRVVFMGSPDFAVPALRALIEAGHEIAAVYSQPARAAGRGKKDRLTPVAEFAQANGLALRTPVNFKSDDEISAFAALEADVAVVVAYGLLLPKRVLDAPRHGCVNLHASLLPRWRGAAPIHRAIMAGDRHTGVCLMRMSEGLDEGPVYARATVEIAEGMTTGILHNVLANLGAELLVENLERVYSVYPTPQASEGITYAKKIQKEETPIEWSRAGFEVMRHIHGLSPFPGAWSAYRGERIKFHQVEMVDQTGKAGMILDDAFTIACGDFALRPIVLQREGKKAMRAEDVLRGLEFTVGEFLQS